MTDIRQQLNDAQWEAVSYCDGPSLVIAGAGSGKTRVLTYKIAYLIERGFSPWNILALTFTNKAAREMNSRIAEVVGSEATRWLWSGTFHSIFARILRAESEALGYPHDFTIYDTADSRSLIKAIVKEMQLDDKLYKAPAVAARISEAKNALVLPDAYCADASIAKRDQMDGIPKVGKIYTAYCARCRVAAAMDFDDLLLNTFLLLRDFPAVRQKYMERFQYILVDEYQDTNVAQHRIVNLLTTPVSRISVVGDDAQSIYAFRGARIDNILGFSEQYPTARLIKLERNYRSTQTIVGAANSIIRHNREQIPKKVYSEAEVGEPIKVFAAYSDKDESARIAGEIRRLHRRCSVEYDEIALLYRTNAQSRVLEETLGEANIPYRIYGGLSFYQRKEIKDALAYFRLVCNKADEEAFRRIVNYPARGIGDATVSKIQAAAVEHNVPMFEVAAAPADYDLAFNRGTLGKLARFVELIEGFNAQLAQTGGYELACRIVRESGMQAEFFADTSPENLSRQENLEELLNSIRAVEQEARETEGAVMVPLADYLSQVSLLTDADQTDDGTPKVTLMTVHAAKGLEFEAVFVTGLEQNLFPGSCAQVYPKEMEEERRLFYVAVTRAKRFCYLTYAKSRYRYGKMEFSSPSPFLNEVDERYLLLPDDFFGASARFAAPPQRPQYAAPRLRPLTAAPAVSPVPARGGMSSAGVPPATGGALSVGDRIAHERFGVGEVTALEGSGDSAKATVRFENAGTKKLLLKFAKYTLCR